VSYDVLPTYPIVALSFPLLGDPSSTVVESGPEGPRAALDSRPKESFHPYAAVDKKLKHSTAMDQVGTDREGRKTNRNTMTKVPTSLLN